MGRRSPWLERVDARLGNTVNEVFLKIPPAEARAIFTRLADDARLDANADFAADDWDRAFHFFETNSVGVGGMYYAPKCAEILMRDVVPAMQRQAPALVLKPQDDMRQLLLEQITVHAKSIRKRR